MCFQNIGREIRKKNCFRRKFHRLWVLYTIYYSRRAIGCKPRFSGVTSRRVKQNCRRCARAIIRQIPPDEPRGDIL